MGILAHWIDTSTWLVQSCCLGLPILKSKYDGVYLAGVLRHTLAKFDIKEESIIRLVLLLYYKSIIVTNYILVLPKIMLVIIKH